MNPQVNGVIFLSAVILGAILISVPFLWLRRRGIDSFVNRWVVENGFELVKYEQRSFTPFTLSLKMSRAQEVVFAEVKDKHGVNKNCWLKLGGYGVGLLSYQVECKWVE